MHVWAARAPNARSEGEAVSKLLATVPWPLSCLLAASVVNARRVVVGERSRSRGSKSRALRIGERDGDGECRLRRAEDNMGGLIAGLERAAIASIYRRS